MNGGVAPSRTPEAVSRAVLDAAMKVHTTLGTGLLESAYRACLQHELIQAGHKAEAEVALPVVYDGIKLDVGYRLDLLVDDCVIVELKTAERITPVYEAQIISYLKLSGKSLGLLINFKVAHLRDGIKRFVHGAGWRNPSSP
jgi:GxxExxY protein